MRSLIISLFSILIFVALGFKKDGNEPHILYTGKLVSATVEKTLYKNEKTKQFLLKFIIKNESEKTIGVYLDYEFDAFYPHQYGVHDTTVRMAIRELRAHCEYKTHADSVNKFLLKKYNDKKLSMLGAKQSIEYFVPMEIHVDDHQLGAKEYLIISCDGHLFSTDGKSIAHDCLLKKSVTPKQRDVVFGHPVKFAPLPANADIIEAH